MLVALSASSYEHRPGSTISYPIAIWLVILLAVSMPHDGHRGGTCADIAVSLPRR